MLKETSNLRHTPLIPQAQETMPPELSPLHCLYRQGCPHGAVYSPPKQETARRLISWRNEMETDTPPWASPAVCGEKVGTAASHEQWGPPCTRQAEAERVKRSHREPASEPVTAPHPPIRASVTGTAHARSQGPEEAACGWGHTGPHRSPRQGHALVFRGTAALATAMVSGRS